MRYSFEAIKEDNIKKLMLSMKAAMTIVTHIFHFLKIRNDL